MATTPTPTSPPPLQQQPPVTQVVYAAPAVNFGARPISIKCPQCNTQIVTETTSNNGLVTWISCFVCCLLGCWVGCYLVPFCLPELQDVEHTCPNCKTLLGSYRIFK